MYLFISEIIKKKFTWPHNLNKYVFKKKKIKKTEAENKTN